MNVSVLLLSHNEETDLPRCLAALTWCDDIVLVDSGSTDRTVAIAEGAGVRILTRPFDSFAGQRNFGLENGAFKHEWVLHLDCDEVVTPEFLAALKALAPQEGIDAYHVPSKTMMGERWLRRAGMYPVYQVRLGHRDRLRFIQVGHGQREDLPRERLAIFSEPYLHYTFSKGLQKWFAKHVVYARDEAQVLLQIRNAPEAGSGSIFSGDGPTRRRAIKRLVARLPVVFRPVLRFVYIYILRLGILDGLAGLTYAMMMSIYEGMVSVLVLEDKILRRKD